MTSLTPQPPSSTQASAPDGFPSQHVPSGFDAHGIQPVDIGSRTSSAPNQFWIWAGANLAPINWVLGTVGVTLGLSLVETVAVIAVGNALGAAIFGAFCVMGHRTGVNAMVLSRLAFGRRGAWVPAFAQILMPMAWVGVNTWVVLDLTVTALAKIGITGGVGLEYLIAFVIMAIQVGVATWGYYAIEAFERWTMPIIGTVMVVMTIVALIHVKADFTTSTVAGADKVSAISQLMTVIGVGWGITWLVYAADYTRFTKPALSDKTVFTTTFFAMFIPVVWLASLGAFIASSGSGTDPAELVITAFGALAVPVLLLIVHGPIATNIVVMYSSTLAALTMDLKIARWKLSLFAGVVGSIVLYFFLQSDDFANSISGWMGSLVVWISPWAGITLVDFFLLRRGRADITQLYAEPSRTVDIRWPGLLALALGLVAGWSVQMGAVDLMQGPFAKALGGIDLSWLVGLLVGAVAYYLLSIVWARRGTIPMPAPSS
ncbi:MAG: cytosine permease [Comamonadaceae bacterium]|nr:MAG: cytosine permease [Comamonadaceae bacterium]